MHEANFSLVKITHMSLFSTLSTVYITFYIAQFWNGTYKKPEIFVLFFFWGEGEDKKVYYGTFWGLFLEKKIKSLLISSVHEAICAYI